MGGRVLFALSIAAFPEELPRDTLAAIFDGAASKVREAGGTLAGGHTIRDPEPKYGLAVIGAAHPGPAPAQGRRATGRHPDPDEAARDRACSSAAIARAGRRDADLARRDRPDAHAQPGRVGGARRATASRRDRRHRVRAARPRPRDGARHPGRGSCSTPRRCRPSPARSSWPRPASRRAAPPTTGASCCPALTSATGVAARAGHARPRSADVRRAARRDRRRSGSTTSRPGSAAAGVEHCRIVGRGRGDGRASASGGGARASRSA